MTTYYNLGKANRTPDSFDGRMRLAQQVADTGADTGADAGADADSFSFSSAYASALARALPPLKMKTFLHRCSLHCSLLRVEASGFSLVSLWLCFEFPLLALLFNRRCSARSLRRALPHALASAAP
jgi:hypothetical protein